ncbi:MAG: hypothetical protein IKC38_07105 [Clostridia bacterium]|nr:hypothetical protein [Clostridia bacterium]
MIKNGRRGVSIMETVVAMVVIFMVTSAAISIVSSSLMVDTRACMTMEVSIAGQNARECFRFAETPEGFLELLQRVGEYNEAEHGVYTWDADQCVISVVVDGDTMTFEAASHGGQLIDSFSFTKGIANGPGGAAHD